MPEKSSLTDLWEEYELALVRLRREEKEVARLRAEIDAESKKLFEENEHLLQALAELKLERERLQTICNVSGLT